MEKVSIVIPVYNAESYIDRSLNSVVTQSYRDLEIIVVDDGSTDNSVQYIKEWKKKDNRIVLVSQENKGPAAARNTGIKKMTGKYLTFLDADDEFKKDAIMTMIKAAEQYDASYYVFGIDTPGNGAGELLSYKSTNILSKRDYIDIVMCNDYECGGGFPFAKLWRVGGDNGISIISFNESIKIYEDKAFVLENAKQLSRIVVLPQKVYEYYIHSDSLSHRVSIDKIYETVKGMEVILERMAEDCSQLALVKAQENYYKQVCIYIYYNKAKCDEKYIEICKRHWLEIAFNNKIGIRTRLRTLVARSKCV